MLDLIPILTEPWVSWPMVCLYLLLWLVVSIHGLHRLWMVWAYWRTKDQSCEPKEHFENLPALTVQLPMYNESAVARRIIDAACRLDYPRDRLCIQVLDDSTDKCQHLAKARVEHWSKQGVDIHYIHRPQRDGYKAGALQNGLSQAKGEFIALFDADFVPPTDFLLRCIDHFTDPSIGMVQARWEHLNRGDSILTRAQAAFLDGHFFIEHAVRHRTGRWFNFNGTAGIWRRETIEQVGGWQHDTLTEDVDISYRAQLAGWKFVYRPDIACPAELPPQINAFKSQQHRWAKGLIQSAVKLLPTILASKAPLKIKCEAIFHLTGPLVYLWMTLLVLLLVPTLAANSSITLLALTAAGFGICTASIVAFYFTGQRAGGQGFVSCLVSLPALMGIGVGVALNNARGVIEALIGVRSPFVRTAKFNRTGSTAIKANQRPVANVSNMGDAVHSRRRRVRPSWMVILEIALGLYVLVCIGHSLDVRGVILATPFLLIIAAGYLYVAACGLFTYEDLTMATQETSATAS